MDEIDRELKQIQLQRERLALKRELEQSEWKANTISSLGRGFSHGGKFLHREVGRINDFLKRWSKLILLTFVVGPAIYGGYVGVDLFLEKRMEKAQSKYQKDLESFVFLKCEKVTCSKFDPNFYEDSCINDRLSRLIGKVKDSCESKAQNDFSQINGEMPSR